jgi:hypothetical protein
MTKYIRDVYQLLSTWIRIYWGYVSASMISIRVKQIIRKKNSTYYLDCAFSKNAYTYFLRHMRKCSTKLIKFNSTSYYSAPWGLNLFLPCHVTCMNPWKRSGLKPWILTEKYPVLTCLCVRKALVHCRTSWIQFQTNTLVMKCLNPSANLFLHYALSSIWTTGPKQKHATMVQSWIYFGNTIQYCVQISFFTLCWPVF